MPKLTADITRQLDIDYHSDHNNFRSPMWVPANLGGVTWAETQEDLDDLVTALETHVSDDRYQCVNCGEDLTELDLIIDNPYWFCPTPATKPLNWSGGVDRLDTTIKERISH